MRGDILIVIVLLQCLVALVRPRWGLYCYVWFSLMRPDALAWATGTFPYSLLLAIFTIAGSIPYLGGAVSLIPNPMALGTLALFGAIAASAYNAVVPALSTYEFNQLTRAILICLLIPVLVRTYEHLKELILVMALSLGVVGLKFGAAGIAAGGMRYEGGIGGMMGDNNMLGLGLVMALPLCWYAREGVAGKWMRRCLTCCAFFTIPAIIMTFSRGAAVALAFVLVMIALRSPHKFRILAVLALAAGPTIYLVGDSYTDRLATIQDPAEESSAASRLKQNDIALQMWKDYPLFGVGYGGTNYMRLVPKYSGDEQIEGVIVHNTYLQMLVDSGIFACAFYILLLGGTILWLTRCARGDRIDPGYRWLARALQVSLVGFAIDAIFHPRCGFDFTYMLIMAAATLYMIVRREGRLTVSPEETPEDLPAESLAGV